MEKIVVNEAGLRLDKYLSDNTEHSRSMIIKLLENDFILVNGKKEKASYKVKENDLIEILDGFKEENDIIPVPMDLDIVYEDDDILLFHDAVRPLVSRRIIDDCLAAMERYDAVDVAFNTTDTIIQVDSDNCISSIPDRNFLRNGQTPQVFRRSLIAEAYKIALQDSAFRTTDDCGVVLRYLPNEPIYVVPGEARNMKVTFKEDIGQIQHLMQMLKKQRVGQ